MEFGCLIPDQEDWVGSDEVGGPLIGLLDNVHVYAVFEIFLHVRINKQVKRGKIGERHELRQGCALLVTELLEQLEVQVAHLLLSDGRLGVNWVKPGIRHNAASLSLRSETFFREFIFI